MYLGLSTPNWVIFETEFGIFKEIKSSFWWTMKHTALIVVGSTFVAYLIIFNTVNKIKIN